MKNAFSQIAKKIAEWVGHPATFSIAVVFVLGWLAGGLFRGFTSYYLESFITGMEIVAVLLLLILQRATNVSDESQQLKMNEILRTVQGENANRLDIEEQSDAERAKARQRDHEAIERNGGL